jgi:hypothetical protein
MRNLSYLILLSVILSSCSEHNSNPLVPATFSIASTADSVSVFPGETKSICFVITSTEPDTIYPVVKDTVCEFFKIAGPWFNGQMRDKIYFGVTGYKALANPVTVMRTINIGDQFCQVSINIKVPEFYLANSFSNNAPNDTIVIQRGSSFLLSITCHDASGRITPKAEIDRLNVNRGCSWYEGSYNPKMSVVDTNKDTVNYYFILSTFPDILPSDDDRFREFTFILSDKRLTIPIKINY